MRLGSEDNHGVVVEAAAKDGLAAQPSRWRGTGVRPALTPHPPLPIPPPLFDPRHAALRKLYALVPLRA